MLQHSEKGRQLHTLHSKKRLPQETKGAFMTVKLLKTGCLFRPRWFFSAGSSPSAASTKETAVSAMAARKPPIFSPFDPAKFKIYTNDVMPGAAAGADPTPGQDPD